MAKHSIAVMVHRRDLHDLYLSMLCCVLAGYALFGKGFAYVGVPPLFIGEVALLLGLVVLVRSGCLVVAFATPASLATIAFMTWIIMRMVPGIGEYGIDAVRDGVIGIYGLFASVAAALIVEKPKRLLSLMRWFSGFTLIYPAVALMISFILRFYADALPVWPSSGVPIILLRNGELLSHLAGVTVFTVLAFGRGPLLWMVSMLACFLVAGSYSRGGMLAFIIPVSIALLVSRVASRITSILAAGVLLILLALSAGVIVPSNDEEYMRTVSVQQVVNNLGSIFSSSGDEVLDGTKMWRLQWWDAIINYTLFGERFWTGRGFGINIAIEDGFESGDDEDRSPLRSPHNGHLTILARSGVPGLVIWVVMLTTWAGSMLLAAYRSSREGAHAWSRLFIFLFCYWLAFIIDATFDVALEGPMIGIWFWTVHGLGIGALMIRATEVDTSALRGR